MNIATILGGTGRIEWERAEQLLAEHPVKQVPQAPVTVRQWDAKRGMHEVVYEGPCDMKAFSTLAGLQNPMLGD